MPVAVGFKIALRCGGDDAAMLHKAEPVRHKLRQAVAADTDHTKNTQRHRHRNDDHQADVERQRQIKQRLFNFDDTIIAESYCSKKDLCCADVVLIYCISVDKFSNAHLWRQRGYMD